MTYEAIKPTDNHRDTQAPANQLRQVVVRGLAGHGRLKVAEVAMGLWVTGLRPGLGGQRDGRGANAEVDGTQAA